MTNIPHKRPNVNFRSLTECAKEALEYPVVIGLKIYGEHEEKFTPAIEVGRME